jgi:hypothetical protein
MTFQKSPRIGSSHNTIQLSIELIKLQAFGDVLGLNDTTRIDCKEFVEASFAKFVQECLERISAELKARQASLSSYRRIWTTSYSRIANALMPGKLMDEPIRQDIRKLCESLHDQARFGNCFIQKSFEQFHSEEALKKVEICGEKTPDLYADIGIHAKLKRPNEALQRQKFEASPERLELVLDWTRAKLTGNTWSRSHHLGEYNPQRVLIE